MRKAASIARGAWSETSEPSVELISTLKLMSPSPIVTGSMRSSTLRTRSSRNENGQLQVEAEPVQHRQRHRELDDRADEDADRVAVELVVAGEHLLRADQADEDDQVPHQRAERRDREVVVGVEDPDHEPVEAEHEHDREQDAAQAHRQVVEAAPAASRRTAA